MLRLNATAGKKSAACWHHSLAGPVEAKQGDRGGPRWSVVLTDEGASSRVEVDRISTGGPGGREPGLSDGLERQAEEAVGHVVQLLEGGLGDGGVEEADGGRGGPEADAVEGLSGAGVSHG